MLKQPDITMNALTCCFSIGLYIIYTDEALFCHVLVLLILIVCMIYIMCIVTLKISWGLSTSHWAMQCLIKPGQGFFYQLFPTNNSLLQSN